MSSIASRYSANNVSCPVIRCGVQRSACTESRGMSFPAADWLNSEVVQRALDSGEDHLFVIFSTIAADKFSASSNMVN